MQNPIVKGLATPSSLSEADRSGDIGRDARPRRGLYVRHVVEALAAPARAGRPAEPVDRQGIDAPFREAQRELLVERMETADVRQDRDAGPVRRRRARTERREAVAVVGRDLDQPAVECGTGDRVDGRSTVVIEAHRNAASGMRSPIGSCRRSSFADRIVPPIGCAEIVALHVESSRIVHDARRPPRRRPDAVHEPSLGRTQMRRNRRIARGDRRRDRRGDRRPDRRRDRPRGRQGTAESGAPPAVECRDARPPRRPEVRRLVGRRRGPHQARRPAHRARARGRPRRSSSWSRRWATPPTSCSASPPRSPTSPTRASSTCCWPPASTRARRSLSMALHAIGIPAISLTGPQAGITTDGTLRPRAHRRHRAAPGPRRARARQGRHRRRLPGRRATQSRDRPARSRRSAAAAATRRRWRWRPRSRAERCQIFTDVRGHLHGRPAARAGRPPAARHRLRGDARARAPGRPGHAGPRRRARLGQRCRHRGRSARSRTHPGTLIKEDPLVEQRNKVRGLAHDRNVAKVTIVAVPDRPGIARAIFEPLADAGVNVDMIVQNVGHDGDDRHVVHGRPGRARQGQEDARADRPRARRPRADDRRVGGQGLASSARACTTRRATRRGCSGRWPTRASTSR